MGKLYRKCREDILTDWARQAREAGEGEEGLPPRDLTDWGDSQADWNWIPDAGSIGATVTTLGTLGLAAANKFGNGLGFLQGAVGPSLNGA